jgi:uncharacterized DUF497 family protein
VYRKAHLENTTGVPYIMNETEFEWDAVKAEGNLTKHGVSFIAATYVFDDIFALECLDYDSQPSEIRYMIIGAVNGIVLTVVYTERGERIRIISARKATKHEQKEYYHNQTAP